MSISLNKISTITSDIVKIQWFKKVGEEIDSSLYSYIKNYCQYLNINKNITQVSSWEEANKIINDNYPYFLGNSFMNGYRANRIELLFLSSSKIGSPHSSTGIPFSFINISPFLIGTLEERHSFPGISEDGSSEKITMVLLSLIHI